MDSRELKMKVENRKVVEEKEEEEGEIYPSASLRRMRELSLSAISEK